MRRALLAVSLSLAVLAAGCSETKPDCKGGAVACGEACVDLRSDNLHCGACGNLCEAGKACSGGSCALTCQAGLLSCSGKCVDPLTDRAFCGASGDCAGANDGSVCTAGQVCTSGTCAVSCQPGLVECEGKCVNPSNDPRHCGADAACGGGHACPSGFACDAGACALACQAGLVDCAGRCVDPRTDRAFCGADAACQGGTICGAGYVCVAGACAQTCPAGEFACGGRCVDPASDPGYCGAGPDCTGGSACGAGTCKGGTCVAPAPTGCAGLPRAAGTTLKLVPVASGLVQPVHAAAPRGDARRLFVVEQPGRIRLVKDGALLAAPYLDLAAQVAFGGERGLLSVAFHPSFATNGRLYVYFTGNGTGDPAAGASGDVRVVEATVADPTADVAGPIVFLRNLVTIPHQAFGNHNGGQLAFGPDGYLYAGTGDGGGGGDPLGSGQDTASLLGKLLRLDVDRPDVPVAGNPFGTAVYHYGLRNPWRFSFDRQTGDLYVGDVGQNLWEEIDFQAAAAPGQAPAPGTNWGWNVMEGNHCYAAACDTAGKARPIAEYSHAEGSSVTGGFVYRGVVMPDLAASGTYFYGDFVTGFVRTLRVVGGVAVDPRDLTASLGGAQSQLSSFGEDGCGELYVVRLSGTVAKLVPP